MRYLAGLAIASTLALFVAPQSGRAQGNDWAFDFKMTDSGTAGGQSGSGVTFGHAVVSKGRIRMDMKGNSRSMAMPGMGASDEISIIVQDKGKLITYLLPKTKQYMQFNPAKVMKQMQKMFESLGAAVTFAYSGPDPKVENLGKGPVILGHETVHYRVTIVLKMTMAMMGERQTMEMASTADQYLAPGLGEVMDPFYGMKSIGQATSMFGAANRGYMEKMEAVKTKLPKAPELRGESHVTMSGPGQQSRISTLREITKIQRVNASPDLFTIPSAYKKIEMPMGTSANAGR